MESRRRIVCKIFGRVQGVMFRDFVARNAKKFGLIGEVRNLDDGTVYVIAEGAKVQLEEFSTAMKKGSMLSRVDDVGVDWDEPSNEFDNFRIIYY